MVRPLRKKMEKMKEFEEDFKKMEMFKGVSTCLHMPVADDSEYLT